MGWEKGLEREVFFKGLTKLALNSNGGRILELGAVLLLLLHDREGETETF